MATRFCFFGIGKSASSKGLVLFVTFLVKVFVHMLCAFLMRGIIVRT